MSRLFNFIRRGGAAGWMIASGLVLAVGAAAPTAGAVGEGTSAWVHPGPDGKLIYKTTPMGDRIMDFSSAGYMGGGVALPTVPVKRTVQPSGGADDTATIQAAIDAVAALPLEGGFRGAVLLAPGTFTCAQPITISASGVVLRGSGSGENGSTIKMAGDKHTAVVVGGRRGRQPPPSEDGDTPEIAPPGQQKSSAIQTSLAEAYVPSGSMTFTVTEAKGFAVGDTIEIRRPVTAAWVKFMQMDDLTRDGRPQTWIRPGGVLVTERRIAALAGNKITLDVPLSDSFDAKFLNPPGTTVAKISPPARVRQVGVEHLHIASPRQEVNHTQELYTAVRLNGEDCWMRDVIIEETMNSVGVGGRRLTLERVSVIRQARHQGASKPAEFAPNAGQVLLDRCSVDADNVWFAATGAGQAGPIVMLNCTFRGNGHIEGHMRWTTGLLLDNCRLPDGGIDFKNRGEMGSGHGWGMGWAVAWNCVAKTYVVQQPPGAYNWAIGCVGERVLSARPFGTGPNLPEGVFDSPGQPVAPRSLYLTQLAERLGPAALQAIGYASPNLATESAPRAAATPISRAAEPALGVNLAIDRPVLTSNVRGGQREFAGWQALDNDDQTYWATDDGVAPATLELDTEGGVEINALELGEARGLTGQVQSYKVEGFVNSAWKLLAQGTTIGERKIDRFPRVTVWKVRLTILEAKPYATIRTFGLYLDRTAAPESPIAKAR